MFQSSSLKAIEVALTRAAAPTKEDQAANTGDVQNWLNMRRQCIEQDAERGRTLFSRVLVVLCVILLFLLLLIWILNGRAGSTVSTAANPAATPTQTPTQTPTR